jgi:HK97 family phage portal protein
MGLIQSLGQLFIPGYTPPAKKALYDLHPELRDRTPLLRMQGNNLWITTDYPYAQATSDHAGNVWMNKAVKLISDAVAVVPLVVTQDGKPTEMDVPLLDKPNGTQAPADVWRSWAVAMMLGGECGLEIVKAQNGRTPLEWWVRTPDVLQVVPDPARKRYGAVAGYIIDDNNGDPYTLPPDEFIHFKFVNPRNTWRGVSPFIAARLSMKIDRHAREWAKDFFENSARPDFAIVAPEGTTKTERDELLASVLAMYRGSQNGAIVLEQNATDIKTLSFAPKDINFTEQREMSRDEVAAAAGIPDILMGFGNDSYDTPDKRTNAEATMWSLTIKPMLDYRDEVLTMWYRSMGLISESQRITSDLSTVPALKGDYTQKLQQAALLNAMNVPFNIIDQKLELGIGAIPGGDVGAADRNPFMLPAGNAPAEDESPPLQLSAGIHIIKPKAKGLALPKGKAVEFGSELHRELFELSIKRADPYERAFAQAVEQLFREQQDAVIEAVRREAKSIAELGDSPFDEEEWAGIFARRMLPEYRKIMRGAGLNALDDIGAGIDFDMLNPRVISALRRLAQRFAKRVTETTWNALKAALEEGLKAGEGADQLAARVEQTMQLRINQSAGAIARTETMSAITQGSLEGWRQGGVEQKTWIATFDDRVRDSHADAHGQTVGIDDNFTVGTAEGPGPGQMDEAGEAINCRCTMLAIQN